MTTVECAQKKNIVILFNASNMSARFDSDCPETTEIDDTTPPPANDAWTEDSAVMVRKLHTNSERLRLATEALALLPTTPDGIDAMFLIEDLLETIHETPYDKVEDLFRSVRLIYETWKISLQI